MFLSFGLFICLAIHFTVAHLVAKRLGLTQLAAPRTSGVVTVAPAAEPRDLRRRIWLSQLSGPAVAYAVAALSFFAALQLAGADAPTTRIVVVPGKAASNAGLQSGDRVLTIAGGAVSSWLASLRRRRMRVWISSWSARDGPSRCR
jgi:hypothetical protein